MYIYIYIYIYIYRCTGVQRHINGVVSKSSKYNDFGFGGIKRPFCFDTTRFDTTRFVFPQGVPPSTLAKAQNELVLLFQRDAFKPGLTNTD